MDERLDDGVLHDARRREEHGDVEVGGEVDVVGDGLDAGEDGVEEEAQGEEGNEGDGDASGRGVPVDEESGPVHDEEEGRREHRVEDVEAGLPGEVEVQVDDVVRAEGGVFLAKLPRRRPIDAPHVVRLGVLEHDRLFEARGANGDLVRVVCVRGDPDRAHLVVERELFDSNLALEVGVEVKRVEDAPVRVDPRPRAERLAVAPVPHVLPKHVGPPDRRVLPQDPFLRRRAVLGLVVPQPLVPPVLPQVPARAQDLRQLVQPERHHVELDYYLIRRRVQSIECRHLRPDRRVVLIPSDDLVFQGPDRGRLVPSPHALLLTPRDSRCRHHRRASPSTPLHVQNC
mmetsp:Transcript_19737/g.62130  ORF Transcript_19737/g.62130 Transcript_19737/m.62130 type:complete len:343 (-) Transcript_19737:41-1069(-)